MLSLLCGLIKWCLQRIVAFNFWSDSKISIWCFHIVVFSFIALNLPILKRNNYFLKFDRLIDFFREIWNLKIDFMSLFYSLRSSFLFWILLFSKNMNKFFEREHLFLCHFCCLVNWSHQRQVRKVLRWDIIDFFGFLFNGLKLQHSFKKCQGIFEFLI